MTSSLPRSGATQKSRFPSIPLLSIRQIGGNLCEAQLQNSRILGTESSFQYVQQGALCHHLSCTLPSNTLNVQLHIKVNDNF